MQNKSYSGTYAFKTDKGKVRTNNEDQAQVLVNETGEVLLIACDGMGGALKGDVASKTAIDIITNSFLSKRKNKLKRLDKSWLIKTVKQANFEIYQKSEEDPMYKGMGTTMVCILISDDRIMVGNMGDSRAYLDNGEELKQLTVDQTYVHYLVNTGRITKEEAAIHPDRHVLMNALGIFPSVSITIDFFPYKGEKLLCCTDGLYNDVPIQTIHAILSTDERADQKVNALIMEANFAGGNDNQGIAYWECDKNHE